MVTKWTFILIVTAYVLLTWLHVKCAKSSILAQQSQSSERGSINVSQTWKYMMIVEEDSFRKSWLDIFHGHNGSCKDIMVQVEGLNMKRFNQYKVF